MTKMTLFKIAGCLAVMSLASAAIAADHLDGPGVVADAPADINDLYTFMDGDKVVLIATVFPAAVTDSKFSDAVQYVFHTTSGDTFGPSNKSLDIICTFGTDTPQKVTCLAGGAAGSPSVDEASGDATMDAGLTSKFGMMTIFTGLRKDPFFFNLDGFKKTVEIVVGAKGGLAFDAAGCPTLDAATSMALVNQLKSNAMGMMPAEDFFAKLNGLAIVLKLDKALWNDADNKPTGSIISAWVSTNK